LIPRIKNAKNAFIFTKIKNRLIKNIDDKYKKLFKPYEKLLSKIIDLVCMTMF